MKNILAGLAVLFTMATLARGAAPQVEVELLSGKTVAGTLLELSDEQVQVETKDGTRQFSLVDVLEVRNAAAKTLAKPAAVSLQLIDKSRLSAESVTLNTRRAEITSSNFGQFSLNFRQIRSLRYKKPADEQAARWSALHEREEARDLLVIPKTREEKQGEDQTITIQTLDYLKGTVSEIDKDVVKFVYNGQTIPVKLDKVFGVIFSGANTRAGKSSCVISLNGSDRVLASAVVLDGEKLTARLASGADVSIPTDSLQSLDFSQGKIQYLSAMEPREYEHTEFFGFGFDYSRDKTGLDKKPLRLGGKDYRRGLWIHTKTRLKYRLGGEYRRFQAVLGIDEGLANKALGDAKVVISGDGKVLFEKTVLGKNDPEELDFDVTGIRDLEILVDWVDENDLGYCDHIDLADAKVIK
ncbi:MAG: NPCBM/NEW2 domain-containing protein [Planctomycetota bacterium]|nr:NPCBM/NEW2 domain-containing protein [Planctomycetota bacterium]